MTSIKAFIIRVARQAKREGKVLDKEAARVKEPFRQIFIDEYNRFQPRGK